GIEADHAIELHADAAGAHEADDRGRAHIDLEAQQHIGDEIGHDLRHDAVADFLEPVSAGAANALDRPHRGILVDLGKQLAERACRVDGDRHHAGQRPDADGEDEYQRVEYFGNATADLHEAPRYPVDG